MKKVKKKFPELRFKGFDGDWEQRKLNTVLTESLISGTNGSIARKLTVKLWGKGIVEKTEIYKGSRNTKYYVRRAGQFMYGKLDFLHQAFGLVPSILDGFESTIDSPAFDIDSKTNSLFILATILRKNFYLREGMIANGSRKAKRINQDTFLAMEVRVPEKKEQDEVSRFTEEIDNTIALHERKLDLLKRLKVAYQQQLFPEKGAQLPHLRFSGFTAGWEQRTLTEHITSSLGGGTPSTSIAKYWEGNLPWIQSSDLAQDDLHSYRINKHISESAVKETAAKHIPANSMAVVVRVGVGKVVIPETDYSTSQDFISLVGLKGDKDFLLYAIHRLLKRLAINTQGTSIKGITKSNLIESKVLSPKDKREQVLIGQLLSKIDTCIAIHQRELDRLRELKMAYIQKLFA